MWFLLPPDPSPYVKGLYVSLAALGCHVAERVYVIDITEPTLLEDPGRKEAGVSPDVTLTAIKKVNAVIFACAFGIFFWVNFEAVHMNKNVFAALAEFWNLLILIKLVSYSAFKKCLFEMSWQQFWSISCRSGGRQVEWASSLSVLVVGVCLQK